jgi:anti-anti-sigma factor
LTLDPTPRGEAVPRDPSIVVELHPAGVHGFAAVIALHGEHDVATAPDIEQGLRSVSGHVLVDLSRCDFIDSTVIGVLISTSRILARDGYRMELLAPPENTNVARVLELVGMRDLMVVHASRPEIAPVALVEADGPPDIAEDDAVGVEQA